VPAPSAPGLPDPWAPSLGADELGTALPGSVTVGADVVVDVGALVVVVGALLVVVGGAVVVGAEVVRGAVVVLVAPGS
jgi:hypothetical protein